MACLVLPIIVNARQTSTQAAPKHTGDVLKLARLLRTVRKTSSKSSFQQLSILLSERLVSEASSVKGVAYEISELSESQTVAV